MKKILEIEEVFATEILDSRGNPTLQVTVILEDGTEGVSMVPSGASTGSFEAVELRDNQENRYNGKGVLKAVNNVNDIIGPELKYLNVYNQKEIDNFMIRLDGTVNKSKLGANSILGVSLAVAKAAANSLNLPLYEYIGGINAKILPIPMMNILNGGRHANSSINIQEFMIVPILDTTFQLRLQMCSEVYHCLKKILKARGYSTGIGDEGGFAPNLKNDEQAIELIIEAIEKAGYETGKDFMLALDVAATEMHEEAKSIDKQGNYLFWKNNEVKTRDEMIDYLCELVNKYPIISIEDGLSEEDWIGWKILSDRLKNKIMLVGDDLFVTNIERLKKGIELGVANSILIKPNQIGTLTETLNTIQVAKMNGYKVVMSHRSGETEDTTIADLAVATNSMFIKAGAPCRSERTAKYNRLINIENEIINSWKLI